MEREKLVEQLKDGVSVITFIKTNGDTRVMRCTLDPKIIPEEVTPSGKMVLSESTKRTTLRVYDVEAKGWRSFKIATVIRSEIGQ